MIEMNDNSINNILLGIKDNWKKICGSIVFILFVFIVLTKLTYLFRNADFYRATVTGIKEIKQPIDLLVVGGSECMVYYDPIKAYEECGVLSYNMSTNALPAEAVRYYIEEAVKYAKINTVAIGVRTVSGWSKDVDGGYLRQATDSMNINFTRQRLLNEYFRDRDSQNEDKLSYYFDLAYYHDKKETLATKENWQLLNNYLPSEDLGFQWHAEYQRCERTPEGIFTSECSNMGEKTIQLCDEIIDVCKKNNINCVFIVTPYQVRAIDKRIYNSIEEYVVSKGCDYIDFNEYYDDMNLDFSTDLYNSYHVNSLGAEKFTVFSANLLKDKYNLNAITHSSSYIWEKRVKNHDTKKDETLKSIEEAIMESENIFTKSKEVSKENDFTKWCDIVSANPHLKWCIVAWGSLDVDDKDEILYLENLGIPVLDGKTQDNLMVVRTGSELIYNNIDTGEKSTSVAIRPPYHMVEMSLDNNSITIDNTDYCKKGDVNIVVYENDYMEVVDSIKLLKDEKKDQVILER